MPRFPPTLQSHVLRQSSMSLKRWDDDHQRFEGFHRFLANLKGPNYVDIGTVRGNYFAAHLLDLVQKLTCMEALQVSWAYFARRAGRAQLDSYLLPPNILLAFHTHRSRKSRPKT